ncbi:ABC transporter substrate-binding protein [Raoultella ornithinolytica]|uniref:ABC transporter substrate-binding protein n=1 Tax=Raoultella ornithinolytica TaxID=54291 RepID=UPI00389EF4FE
MRYCLLWLAALLWAPLAAHADDSWQQIARQARGQTVWFNAWGGDPAVNRYLDWVSAEVKRDYAIDLRIVHIADAADTVKRLQTEARAGRKHHGSVDLLWVNGENFRTLKTANLLQTGWAETLPNWRYVDTRQPVREDFSLPTEGAESPWGSAQLTFIARRTQTPTPPDSPEALLTFAAAHRGEVTYPRPPDFTGTAFLEQLLMTLTERPEALRRPPEPQTFAAVTVPLWRYLDRLHPLLWREGRDFPASPARMDAMLATGTLRLSLTFNPLHARQKAVSGELPKDSYGFGFERGMLGNVHFVTIPANARAPAGARVVANFLLSPAAQLRKADPAVWGDPSVLNPQSLPDDQRQALQARAPQNPPPVLAEPHAAWVDALEQEWLRRYGTH